MQFKLSKTTLQIMLGSMLMTTIAMACNDTSSKKETKTDSTATDTSKMDTMKMDTAKTRPIVPPPDEPANK
jgi:hypothetical protein